MSNLPDLYRSLISDTIAHLKDQYPKNTRLLANEQDAQFFAKIVKAPLPPLQQPILPKPEKLIAQAPLKKIEAPKSAAPPVEKVSEIKPIAHKAATPSQPSVPIEEGNGFMKLEPITAILEEGIEPWGHLLETLSPQFVLHDKALDDSNACRIANAWKEQPQVAEVAILSFGESDKGLLFISHLAKAIDVKLAPAKVIDAARLEKEKKWDLFLQAGNLKLIIAPDKILKTTDFLRFYKENPTTSQRFLDKIPLLLLAPSTSYLKDPLLKRSLWKVLCQMLQS